MSIRVSCGPRNRPTTYNVDDYVTVRVPVRESTGVHGLYDRAEPDNTSR